MTDEKLSESWKERELEKMRRELGPVGGVGHFWGNDRMIATGGVRNWMEESEMENILMLLALGETKINLKEQEFFLHIFLSRYVF